MFINFITLLRQVSILITVGRHILAALKFNEFQKNKFMQNLWQ